MKSVIAKYKEELSNRLKSFITNPNERAIKIDTSKPRTASNLSEIYEGYQHLLWMLEEIDLMRCEDSESITEVRLLSEKCNRWLGFIQGALWSYGIYTIDEMREDNRK